MNKTILLVEDEALIALSEQRMLENYGYKVICVASGEEAIALINKKHDMDLILMDINLQNTLSGTDTAEIILRDHDIPIVFLSSHTDKETIATTEKITSYGYVIKSSGIVILDASIKMAFKLFDMKKRLEKHEQALAVIAKDMERAELAAKIGNWKLDINTKKIIGSVGARRIYGLPLDVEEFDYEIIKSMIVEDRALCDESLKNLIENDIPYDAIARVHRPDGAVIKIRSTAEYDKKTKILFGVIQDITSPIT